MRGIAATLLLMLTLGCSATPASAPDRPHFNSPIGVDFPKDINNPFMTFRNDSMNPGEAIVVGSLSFLTSPSTSWLSGPMWVTVSFVSYDPETELQKLDSTGFSFGFVRRACDRPESDPACDWTKPFYQVVSVPPGHYIMSNLIWLSGRTWDQYIFDEFPRDTKRQISVARSGAPRVEVRAGEIVDIGDIQIRKLEHIDDDANGDANWADGHAGISFRIRQDEEAAGIALRAAGITSPEVVLRSATGSGQAD